MQITKIEFYFVPEHSKSSLKANVNIEIDDSLRLTDLAVYMSETNVLFVGYPIKGNFRQSFYPTKKALKEYIEKTILDEYKERTK